MAILNNQISTVFIICQNQDNDMPKKTSPLNHENKITKRFGRDCIDNKRGTNAAKIKVDCPIPGQLAASIMPDKITPTNRNIQNLLFLKLIIRLYLGVRSTHKLLLLYQERVLYIL